MQRQRRGGFRPGCDRHGRRRLDPASRLPYWPCRLQAINWPLAARRRIASILTDFETIGSLARTVEDTLLLDAILRGRDPRDWRSSTAPAPSWPKKTARILYVPRFGAAPVDPEVASQLEKFAPPSLVDGT